MTLAMCPLCLDDEDIYVVRQLEDGRKLVECRGCKYQWEHGQPTTPPTEVAYTFDQLKARCPVPEGQTAGERDASLDSIGNLTLLTGRLNSKVSNGPWGGEAGKRVALHAHDVLMLNRQLLD